MTESRLPRAALAPALRVSGRLASSRLAVPVALAVIVLCGAVLRFHGLGWDQPAGSSEPLHMHPDERFLSIVTAKISWPDGPGEYFDTAKSPLNPYNAPDTPSFVYGTFPLFLAKAVASLPGDVVCDGDSYATTVVCGRRLTATVDTLTILLVFALGALLVGRVAGLAAAGLYALAVLPTQLAHFWAVDPYVVFFATASLVLSVLLLRRGIGAGRDGPPTVRGTLPAMATVLGLGLCIGLGLASKVTAWPVALAPVLMTAARIAMRDWRRLGLRWQGREASPGGHWTTDISVLATVAVIAMVVFRVAQPYAFEGPNVWNVSFNQQWWDDILREIDFQDGNVDFPPFVQFANRTPFLWPLENLVLWGTGPALGVCAFLAAGVAAVRLFKRRELTFLLPLCVLVSVIAFQGGRFVAYMRYFAPVYPLLCLFAAWALVHTWQAAHASPRARRAGSRLANMVARCRPGGAPFRVAAMGAVVLVTGMTAAWALAFQHVYSAEHPRIAASEWIYDNVPPGAVITGEIWDDTIPFQIPGRTASYRIANTYPYDTDTETKVRALIYGRQGDSPTVGLDGADYVAITSDRVRESVKRLPAEYPATIRYYQLLDSGELGFDLVAHFEVRPELFGISIDDSGAEESFTVYDHPEVRIYKKSDRWDPAKALALLEEAHPERAVNLLPRQGRTNGLQFTPAEAATQQSSGTFSDLFDTGRVVSAVPWLWWLIWLEAAALATVPLVTWLFRAFPDRGYGLSKLAGFAGVGLIAWFAVAWGVVEFSAGVAWFSLAIMIAAGYALGFVRRKSLAVDFREHWRSWVAVEVVFFAVFAAFLAIRYANPDLWYNPQGGEKPIELAYLTAVAKSATLPPYDPWFSGGTMNYYYMGWFLVAVPLRALRILPEVGFNLALPTYAALAGTVCFSTVHNLVGLSRRAREPGVRPRRRFRWRLAALTGLVGVVLFIGIGNLDAGHQTIERLQALNIESYDASGAPIYRWTLFSDVPFLGGAVGFVSGAWRWLFQDASMAPFDWWKPSRVHPPAFDITEFPYWSFLFGDLHAHVMGLPFFGLTIALFVAYVASATRGLRRHTWALAAAVGLSLGLERTVHTWDFPTAVVLSLAAVVAGQILSAGRWQRRWWDGVGHCALAGAILIVAFSPYTQHTEVFESGIVRARETTRLNQYFAHFGLFVVIALAFIAVRYHEELRARAGNPGRNPLLILVSGWPERAAFTLFIAGLGAFSWIFGLATLALSAVVLLFLTNLLWLEWRSPNRDPGRLLATGIFAAAVGVAGGVDAIQAEYDIVRMNTVFKFSLQAWQLYAVASAYALWYVGGALWMWDRWRLHIRPRRILAASAFASVVGVLFFAAATYVWSGTRTRQEARFDGAPSGTLDGLAYMPFGVFNEDKGTPQPADDRVINLGHDLPLIEWLRANVKGSPVIVEAVGPLYHWTGRISWNTGLPTVIGWDWHEVAYRTDYDFLVQQRRLETAKFYTDPTPGYARQFIEKYNVSYVIVGTEEFVFGTPAGLAKFDKMPELEAAFRSGPYVIYRVRQEG